MKGDLILERREFQNKIREAVREHRHGCLKGKYKFTINITIRDMGPPEQPFIVVSVDTRSKN